MIYMHHFYVFAKNDLHLELGAGCLYSPRIREGVFPETRPGLVRSAKLAIRFYRQGGPTYTAAAGLLSVGNRYASSSSWDQNNSDRPSSNQTVNPG